MGRKTILFNMLLGTFPPTSGTIVIDGHDVIGWNRTRYLAKV